MSSVRAVTHHCWLTLKLNFRSKQAILYGYFVPLLFLVAFGSVFRGDTPRLLGEIGQLLTLTILGGCCIGLPTNLVAERERGVWRRFRLLPVGAGKLILSTIAARTVIVLSGAALQVCLARLFYGTPFPEQIGWAVLAFVGVAIAFTGLGLLIAALASDVPAVQALGQCIFLPMVMIGGVGVPLTALPRWAQEISAYLPGRYAVEVLQRAYAGGEGLAHAGFAFAALIVIGAAAATAGLKLFRWEQGGALGARAKIWVGVALLAWLGVGVTATAWERTAPPKFSASRYDYVTQAQIDAITYDDLTGDNELVTRLAPPFKDAERPGRLGEIVQQLDAWPAAHVPDPAQRVRNLLSIAAIADISADLLEAEIARVIYDKLRAEYPPHQLAQILAWIVISPEQGAVITNAREFGLRKTPTEEVVRERSVYYAQKFLGRIIGKLRD
ncbi:MAG TPA: ABC transporter permease [Opitutaceae bacterium]|nr:ABC transporter permease [Opitutaceae bacterium]